MQLWDTVLYTPFRATIRGEYYGIISQDFIDEECFNLALRAISAFKFPKISTAYTTFYAVRQQDGSLKEVASADVDKSEYGTPATGAAPIQHGRFINDLTYAEIEVIIAWMKVYWAENQVSNADNFDDMYTDANIKTFSRANAVDKNTKLMAEYRAYARDLETRYGRVNESRKPSIGDINE